MKRNETVLVYGVTGLLVVILLVAVLFGNDGTSNAGGKPGGGNQAAAKPDLRDLINTSSIERTCQDPIG